MGQYDILHRIQQLGPPHMLPTLNGIAADASED